MKEFLSECKVNKMETEDLAELISNWQDEIIKFYVKKAHLVNNQKFADTFNTLFEKMAKKKFIKALKTIIKSDYMKLDCGFVVVIAGFIENALKNKEEENDELIDSYRGIIDKLLKKRIKAIKKKVDIDGDVIKELLIIAPSREYISDDKYVGVYSQKMLKKLYIFAEESDLEIKNTKEIKKLFKAIFGEDLLDLIAVNILLEKKETLKRLTQKQQEIWNLMTDFALVTIEEQKKPHITELIEYYCQRRHIDNKNQRDGARRIQLNSIDEEDYKNIAKVVKKLSKNDNCSKYL